MVDFHCAGGQSPACPTGGTSPSALLALFVPIIFCLIRASLIDQSQSECTWARRVGYQVMIALALITLLFFEIGIGFFFGWPGIPLNAWIVVCSIGVGYIFLSCIAYLIDPGASSRLPNGSNADEWD